MTDEDKAKAKDSLKARKGIDIDTARLSVRIAFADKSSKLARKTLDAFKEQVDGLVNLGSDRLTTRGSRPVPLAHRVGSSTVGLGPQLTWPT